MEDLIISNKKSHDVELDRKIAEFTKRIKHLENEITVFKKKENQKKDTLLQPPVVQQPPQIKSNAFITEASIKQNQSDENTEELKSQIKQLQGNSN